VVRIIRAGDATDLGLPGRRSLEIVSSRTGSDSLTLRLVEIPVPAPGDAERAMHRHRDFEECIYVLEGQGVNRSEDGEVAVVAGDTILVPRGQWHVTRNTGDTPLRLLCFFPASRAHETDQERGGRG